MSSVVFSSKPTSINFNAFSGCSSLATIYVPWSEGEVASAPWGANGATIIYDYQP